MTVRQSGGRSPTGQPHWWASGREVAPDSMVRDRAKAVVTTSPGGNSAHGRGATGTRGLPRPEDLAIQADHVLGIAGEGYPSSDPLMESPAFRLRNPRTKRHTPHGIRQRVDILGRNQLACPAKTEGLRDAIEGGCHDRSAAGMRFHHDAAHGLGADLGVHQAVEGIHDERHLEGIPGKRGDSPETEAPDVLLEQGAHVAAADNDEARPGNLIADPGRGREKFPVSLAARSA